MGEDGSQIGIVSATEAFAHATEVGLDLVEIAPQANPPVCRVMDYGKNRFDENKKRRKQKHIVVKEIKFRPGTDIGDYDIKVRRLKTFLEKGFKTKVIMRFRGREIAHADLGLDVLNRVQNDLKDISIVEARPSMDGRQMIMILAPAKPKS